MAAIDQTRTAAVTQPFDGFSKLIHAAYSSLRSWNNRRVTKKVLNHLSDHELEDIGLTRGEIDTLILRTTF